MWGSWLVLAGYPTFFMRVKEIKASAVGSFGIGCFGYPVQDTD